MEDQLKEAVLASFRLNDAQRSAVIANGKDVVVTAGAGSGKTSTLVARYLHLLAGGADPRRIVAITFTKKAALEMKSRVRSKLDALKKDATEAEKAFWSALTGKMDAARVGTIHSLCSEILRAHPAEAGVDPKFNLLDESLGLHYRNLAVEDTLNWMVTQGELLPLLRQTKLRTLRGILTTLLDNRMDVRGSLESKLDYQQGYIQEIRQRLKAIRVDETMDEIESYSPAELEADCGKLAPLLSEVVRNWQEIQETREGEDALAIAQALFDFRWNFPSKAIGKRDSQVKETFFALRDRFEKILDGFFSTKEKIRPVELSQLDHQTILTLLSIAFKYLDQAYQSRKDAEQALDFDDLEYYTERLLRDPAIRARWQKELQAVLVDEYQDTNQRQRSIVNALAGNQGKLFIVGDMRQSIYRFRKADVTVFREEQERIRTEGGELIELDRTYRSHAPLLDALAVLLAGVIGTEADPSRPHYVPFTPMVAERKEAPASLQSPPVEIILGQGGETSDARVSMADALAARLGVLKANGVIERWDEVAILCRASTSFPYYEAALERVSIPFSTVAGKGFYERAEIRDLLNMLRFLADPADKNALVGLLRSPAFGLPDGVIFQLFKTYPDFEGLLQGDWDFLSEENRAKLGQVKGFVEELQPLVDRVHVGELLTMIVDRTDYRAILSLSSLEEGMNASSMRLWRNLDKLIGEAINSKLVSVREFLTRLETLDDAGAREGEAVTEAYDAVTIMTIHKSKGLEFPVVVLGDAGRKEMNRSVGLYVNPLLGISLVQEPPSLAYLAAKQMENEQAESENSRLLYVALTRAKDMLIINGHIRTGEKTNTDGWCKDLLDAAGIDLQELLDVGEEPRELMPLPGLRMMVWCPQNPGFAQKQTLERVDTPPLAHPIPLFSRIKTETIPETPQVEEDPFFKEEGALVISPTQSQARLLGQMVHKALQRWLLPGSPGFESMLDGLMNSARVADPEQRQNLSELARSKLLAFMRHPVYAEIKAAGEKYSELACIRMKQRWLDHRVIDLLYRQGEEWILMDFKSDPIESEAEKQTLIQAYHPQLWAYKLAMEQELGQAVKARICFLSDRDHISIVEL